MPAYFAGVPETIKGLVRFGVTWQGNLLRNVGSLDIGPDRRIRDHQPAIPDGVVLDGAAVAKAFEERAGSKLLPDAAPIDSLFLFGGEQAAPVLAYLPRVYDPRTPPIHRRESATEVPSRLAEEAAGELATARQRLSQVQRRRPN